MYPLGVKLTISGMLLLAWSLVLGRLAHNAPSEELAVWLVRFNWTFAILGWGLVGYGVARIFTFER